MTMGFAKKRTAIRWKGKKLGQRHYCCRLKIFIGGKIYLHLVATDIYPEGKFGGNISFDGWTRTEVLMYRKIYLVTSPEKYQYANKGVYLV